MPRYLCFGVTPVEEPPRRYEPRLDLVALAEALRAAAAAVLLADEALGAARLALAVVVVDVVGVVEAISSGLAGVELAPSSVIGLDPVALAELVVAVAAAAAPQGADELGLDARLGLAVVVLDVVGT